MNRRVEAVIFWFAMLSLQSSGHAQELQNPPEQSPSNSFASTVGGDVLHVFSSPFRLRQEDGLKLLAITAVTTVFVTLLDDRIDENFIERDDFYVKPAIGLAKVGTGYNKLSSKYVLAGLSIPMLAGGLIFKDKKLLETTRLMVEAFLISGVITQLGKRVFGRARPFTGEGSLEFEPFKFRSTRDTRSFPSGHSTSAFSMMTVLSKQYDRWWIKIPTYTLAVSVALQRIDSRNHWGADVVVGGLIGYWVGSTLVNKHKPQSKSTSINPYIFGNRVGVMVNFY
ncbi:MAG: phosphatase PAP2 family protein [Calditrichaeota bacterium]|nr:phosphatase PAP2 family protein [Calditrichota bacterium]